MGKVLILGKKVKNVRPIIATKSIIFVQENSLTKDQREPI